MCVCLSLSLFFLFSLPLSPHHFSFFSTTLDLFHCLVVVLALFLSLSLSLSFSFTQAFTSTHTSHRSSHTCPIIIVCVAAVEAAAGGGVGRALATLSILQKHKERRNFSNILELLARDCRKLSKEEEKKAGGGEEGEPVVTGQDEDEDEDENGDGNEQDAVDGKKDWKAKRFEELRETQGGKLGLQGAIVVCKYFGFSKTEIELDEKRGLSEWQKLLGLDKATMGGEVEEAEEEEEERENTGGEGGGASKVQKEEKKAKSEQDESEKKERRAQRKKKREQRKLSSLARVAVLTAGRNMCLAPAADIIRNKAAEMKAIQQSKQQQQNKQGGGKKAAKNKGVNNNKNNKKKWRNRKSWDEEILHWFESEYLVTPSGSEELGQTMRVSWGRTALMFAPNQDGQEWRGLLPALLADEKTGKPLFLEPKDRQLTRQTAGGGMPAEGTAAVALGIDSNGDERGAGGGGEVMTVRDAVEAVKGLRELKGVHVDMDAGRGGLMAKINAIVERLNESKSKLLEHASRKQLGKTHMQDIDAQKRSIGIARAQINDIMTKETVGPMLLNHVFQCSDDVYRLTNLADSLRHQSNLQARKNPPPPPKALTAKKVSEETEIRGGLSLDERLLLARALRPLFDEAEEVITKAKEAAKQHPYANVEGLRETQKAKREQLIVTDALMRFLFPRLSNKHKQGLVSGFRCDGSHYKVTVWREQKVSERFMRKKAVEEAFKRGVTLLEMLKPLPKEPPQPDSTKRSPRSRVNRTRCIIGQEQLFALLENLDGIDLLQLAAVPFISIDEGDISHLAIVVSFIDIKKNSAGQWYCCGVSSYFKILSHEHYAHQTRYHRNRREKQHYVVSQGHVFQHVRDLREALNAIAVAQAAGSAAGVSGAGGSAAVPPPPPPSVGSANSAAGAGAGAGAGRVNAGPTVAAHPPPRNPPAAAAAAHQYPDKVKKEHEEAWKQAERARNCRSAAAARRFTEQRQQQLLDHLQQDLDDVIDAEYARRRESNQELPEERYDGIVLLGNGKWKPSTGVSVPSPRAVYRKFFARHYLTISCDEYCTSKLCPRCLAELEKLKTNPSNRKSRHGRYRQCPNCKVSVCVEKGGGEG